MREAHESAVSSRGVHAGVAGAPHATLPDCRLPARVSSVQALVAGVVELHELGAPAATRPAAEVALSVLEAWRAESSFGHGVLDVLNQTHALWQWHRNQDGAPVSADSVYVFRDLQRCANKRSAAAAPSSPAPAPAEAGAPTV